MKAIVYGCEGQALKPRISSRGPEVPSPTRMWDTRRRQ